jgi:RNA polymerase sigma factor (sigma-70 family)
MKERPKLTPEQQKLVAQVLPNVLCIARKHARHYGQGHDFEGSVALRLCEYISSFDPGKGELMVWAQWQAHFACRELIRGEQRKKSRCPVRLLSLDLSIGQDGLPLSEQIAAPADPQVDPEGDLQLLRGLDTRTRTVVWKSIVEEVPLKTIAQDLGVSPAWTSEIRNKAINFLRQRAIA